MTEHEIKTMIDEMPMFLFGGFLNFIIAAAAGWLFGKAAKGKDAAPEIEPKDFQVTTEEGVIHLAAGEDKWDGQYAYYMHQFSYDGDASTSPDKGSEDASGTGTDAVDITDLVEIATTGLTTSNAGTAAGKEDIFSKSKMTGGAGLEFDTSSSENTGIKINYLHYQGYEDAGIPKHPKEFIDKICEDAGLLYDLRYDDNTDKVIFKPLQQKASGSPDITLAAGSITSLARERDLSDVFSSVLLTLQSPDQNYFANENIAQYGTNVNNSGTSFQDGFHSDSYSSGGTTPEYFWDITHMSGIGPGLKKYEGTGNAFKASDMWFHQCIWKKGVVLGTSSALLAKTPNRRYGAPTLSDDTTFSTTEVPLHLMTVWFDGGRSLDIENFKFFSHFTGDSGMNGAMYRVQVTTGLNTSDPLSASTTWQNFNDSSVAIKGGGDGTGGFGVNLNKCQVKGVNGIRILSLRAPFAQPGWQGEGRMYLRQTEKDLGYVTYGFGSDGTSSECFSATLDDRWWGSGAARDGKRNRQDSRAFYGTIPSNLNPTTPFNTAISNSGSMGSKLKGYVSLGQTLSQFSVTGVGKKALFIRNAKNQTSDTDTLRTDYSPTYKKIAPLGYKVKTESLKDYSEAEGQSLGQQFLDDKLRRYQARDYSLDGASPFVNSNNLPNCGQTIKVADDSNFVGVLTSYQFTFDSNGARFDFRLESYDRNNTAEWIQAGGS